MKINSAKNSFFSSFRELTRDKWALGATILTGKLIGLFLVLAAIITLPGILGTTAHAAATVAKVDTSALERSMIASTTSTINAINTVWTLVAAFLVFGMQAGFTMLEAGFARKRETVNVLMECIFDTCLCGCSMPAVMRSCLAMVTALSATIGFSSRELP
jgi:Amt family ammonium transporter